MTENDGEDRARQIGTSRMEAFSDGVFAIAITLLVLELAVPASDGPSLLHELVSAWPTYLAYVVSFATIGAVWLGHSIITEYVERADALFLRLNLLLLLVVSFIPFPTRLLGEFIDSENQERVATTLYGVTLLMTAVLLSVLWRSAARSGLISPELGDDDVRRLTNRFTPVVGGYVVMIVVGLLFPFVAVYGYFAIALYTALPVRVSDRRRGTA